MSTVPVLAAAVSERATRFYANRQYLDALKVLQEEIAGKPDAECAAHFLMLGECHFQLGQFAAARPFFTKAVLHLPEGREKKLAEFRLPVMLYRLGDANGALDRITAFTGKYPADPLVSKLLVYQMIILASRGPGAETNIVALHKQIQDNLAKYDHATGMEADQVLCDYYQKTGQDEKAVGLYSRIVQNFRNVISELQTNKQPIPAALEKTHDNAALQLGAIYADKRQHDEARKWLENVRYDLEMRHKARLLLARAAFEQRDFPSVARYLAEQGFIETVPAGPVRSDMFLLLGLAEKNRADGNPTRVEEYLRQVEPGARSYVPAQAALGEIYFSKGLYETAGRAFQNVVNHPDHAASALYHIGVIHLELGLRETDAAKAKSLFVRASDCFNQLFTRFPLSPFIKPARDRAARLAERGVDVSFARSDEENLKAWEATARAQPGRPEGAQALLSSARLHFKPLIDETTGRIVKPPNYAAAAVACDRLLVSSSYKGDGFDPAAWKQVLIEALYLRAQCEIAGVNPAQPDDPRQLASSHVKNASAARAIELFTRAKEMADPKQLELVKGIEIGLLESLFKSDKPEHQDAAVKKFAELESDYGADPRFQKLALDLAGWYANQNRFAEAAIQFAGVAERGKTLPVDELLKLRFSAGSMFSRAALDAQQKPDATNFALYIHPKDIVEMGDNILDTHPPFAKIVDIQWPNEGRNITAGEALKALSEASHIPLVWCANVNPRETIGWRLANHRVTLDHGRYSVRAALEKILDLSHHRLVFDIGLTGATPTIPPAALDDDDPDLREYYRPVEVFDARQADQRFQPLTRSYGTWNAVHQGRRDVLLFSVLRRIEEQTNTRVVWADGIARDDKLAAEFKSPPDLDPNRDYPCASVLARTLDAVGLRYKIVPRAKADDLYEAAKTQFNHIRQLSPKSRFGERSLFALALNYYNQQDYEKMKIVLREYLKLFDNPDHEYYRQACFWVGWAFEKEKRYREACDYYARAAEERLVIYKPRETDPAWSCDGLRSRLGHDTQFALAAKINGELTDRTLTEFADFIQFNARVNCRLDNSVQTADARVSRSTFRQVSAFDLLCHALTQHGLAARVENMDPVVAEKAYFRLASAYKKDNLMEQALENCLVLLDRYPDTTRRQDVYKLMLDVYKGLRDYRNVLRVLEDLKKIAGDDLAKYQLDFEIASIYFDMADYSRAAETFKAALAQAQRAGERSKSERRMPGHCFAPTNARKRWPSS